MCRRDRYRDLVTRHHREDLGRGVCYSIQLAAYLSKTATGASLRSCAPHCLLYPLVSTARYMTRSRATVRPDRSNCAALQTGHSKYVGAVAYAPPGFLVGFPNGAIISGSFDGTLVMWDVGTAAAVHTLKGHQYQVTAIAVLPSGDVASASVDK
eukprot:GHUV01044240.1.p1 GENE.GHUV01044240.1~~GHUV01044240.1.p1  ORF type:complete len:154 (+),score=13.88 GHUV01044240.1:185-646(+)